MGLGAGDEEDSKPARPFFDIELDDASFSTKEPAPVFLGSEPPMPVQIGSLGAAAEPTPSPSPQLTGNVATMDGMFTFPAPVKATKEGFRWGQFFLGLFLPWVVLFAFSLVVEAMEPDWEDMPDFSRAEDVLLTPGEDGWYALTINKTAEESFHFHFGFEIDSETSANIDVHYDRRDVDWEGNGKVRQTNYTRYDADETVIGEYTLENQTLWFQLDNASAEEHLAFLYITDYEAMEAWELENGWGDTDAIASTLFCGFGPIAYIAGLITAFSRGNKALGYGLLCAVPLAVVMGPALVILLLIMFGF